MHAVDAPHTWSSRWVFLLAAIGAAVGLGNVWKFPYMAGVNGGSAFVLVYIIAVVVVAIPLLMAELMIGRSGHYRSPVSNFRVLAAHVPASPHWRFVGWMNITAVFAILTFYSVIAGWTLAYIPRVASGVFAGATSVHARAEFDELLASPLAMAAWHGLFLAITVLIVGSGLQKGIERAVKLLMPALFLMLIVLIGYGAVAGNMARAAAFLFAADFSRIDTHVVLAAIGQAFFSVSVAMGLMITYGAYMRPGENITVSALIIAGADTLVALMAGLAIFPLVFTNGLDPAQGPGLIFVTLPIAFGNMPAGSVFGTLFFFLMLFAALTSSIAILETIISRAVERWPLRRVGLSVAGGLAAWLGGLATVFSFNVWEDIHPLAIFPLFRDKTIFDLVDYFASNILLPLGGLLIALFTGWILSLGAVGEELRLGDGAACRIWRFLIGYVAPAGIGAVLAANLAL